MIENILSSKLQGGLSIVLPVYNEQDNIGSTLDSILEYIPKIVDDYEIIAVNDGSTDNTADILNNFSSRYKEVITVVHDKNRGYGAALKSGFNKAKKEFIFFMDSDEQFRIAEITKLIYFIDRYDIVSGIRIERKDSLIRDINATIFNLAMWFLFRIPAVDINCAFKLFHKDVIKKIKLFSNGALINTEIFARTRHEHKKIMFVGIEHYPRILGRQSGANLKVIIKAMIEIIPLMINLRRDILKLR